MLMTAAPSGFGAIPCTPRGGAVDGRSARGADQREHARDDMVGVKAKGVTDRERSAQNPNGWSSAGVRSPFDPRLVPCGRAGSGSVCPNESHTRCP